MDIKQLYAIYQSHPVVTTDSRDCPEDSIFIALKGASFDGNKFAAMALGKGCAYAVIDEKEYCVEGDDRYILADDCLTTFKELAREHRRQFNIPIVGITGTNGKTTTKELVSAVLAEKYDVMHTEGNFNNDVGVPKTLLRLKPEHEIAVVEMGASHPGDIKKLVEYVEPTCGMITNVGRAHLQGFGSFEGVKKTKGELYDFLKANNALVFLDTANDNLVEMARERELDRVISYGTDDGAEVQGRVTAADPFITIEWKCGGVALNEWHEIKTRLIGSYNLDNVLAAVTVGLHFGVTAEQVCHAIESYEPTNNRSELVKTSSNTLIVDAYNANPTSMAAALDSFAQIATSQPKMAILGDMRELGDVSEAEHQKVVDTLKDKGFEDVWLVGEEFGKTQCDFQKYNNVEEVKQAIASEKPSGKCILIKGSNGTKLFELPKLL